MLAEPQIGITWSKEAEREFEEIKDKVKVIEFDNLVDFKDIGTWTFHYRRENPWEKNSKPLNLVLPESVKSSFSNIKSFLSEKKPEIISVHLGFSSEQVGITSPDGHNYAISPILSREEVKEGVCESLEYLTNSIEIPVGIENLDYHSGGAYEYVCETVFIKEILEENETLWLLLDIAHAEISLAQLEKRNYEGKLNKTRDYLNELPLEKVIQLHVNAPIWQNDIPLDMHSPITEHEMVLLKKLRHLPNLKIVTLECRQQIKQQVLHLLQIFKGE